MSDSTKLDLEKRVLQHLNRIYADVLDKKNIKQLANSLFCLLYTSDAADE